MATKSRFVDQKGQVKSTTPTSVKKRQAKAWAEIEKKVKSGGKSNGKRK